MNENQISTSIIGCAIEVHRHLGPGLLESAYVECMYYELLQKGLRVEKQKPLPLQYKEIRLEHSYRIDLLVENKVVIEAKAVEALNDIHCAQLLTYLKFGDYRLGLLINFYVTYLKQGIKRIVNRLPDNTERFS